MNWVTAMCGRMVHRGPDGEGYWSSRDNRIAFGHRRLSIIDLSELGAQPMTSKSGSVTITYNGEIYNFSSIREELLGLGIVFAGQSDTEVLVEAIDFWGVEETVKKLIGMFAFAVWNEDERTLKLVRDRLGIKPLYYYYDGVRFLFASEMKALQDSGIDLGKLDGAAISQYFRYKYSIAPNTIHSNCKMLEQGCIGTFIEDSGEFEVVRYWNLPEIAKGGQARKLEGSYTEQLVELECLLKDAVRKRMIADVPLGAFLSGGIDSSIVCALMQSMSDKPIKTFTIGFNEGGYNEAGHAKSIAEHLGTEHTELYLEPDSLLEYVMEMSDILAEPFADISLIPTLAVSKMASEHVTVALSGDGGDELFGGYNHYAAALGVWKKMQPVPSSLRIPAANLIKHFSPGYGKLSRLGGLMESTEFDHFYECYLSQWQFLGKLFQVEYSPGLTAKPSSITSYDFSDEDDFAHHMMLRDAQTYMVDDILHKVDIASMRYGLEARVPLIDHRVFEFVWRMPLQYRIKGGVAKAPLKDILSKYMPRELFERPKQGFGVPISNWLKGPLLEWADDMLSPSSISKSGVLCPMMVQKLWNEHKSGRMDRGAYLWSILCFQQWAESRNFSV